MITLLHAVSYIAALAAFLFITLSLASGLLWIAEVIEEHSSLAKKVGRRSIYAIILLQTLLFALDSFPLLPSLFSILCHLVYLQNFSSSWPLISLTSPSFLASCLLVLVDHFVWFWHFSSLANGGGTGGGWKGSKVAGGSPYARPSYAHTMHGSGRGGGESLAFVDVASFFGICVWFIPLYLFLSLSANDNALPTLSASLPSSPSQTSSQSKPKPKSKPSSLISLALTRVLSLIPDSLTSPFRRLRHRSHDDFNTSSSSSSMSFFGGGGGGDGLLAPRTPTRAPQLGGMGGMMASTAGYSPWEKPGTPTGGGVGSQAGYFPSIGGARSPTRAGFGSPGLGVGGGLFPGSPGGGGLRPPPPPRRTVSESGGPGGGDGTIGIGGGRSPRMGGGSGLAGAGGPGVMARKSSMLGLAGEGKSGKDD